MLVSVGNIINEILFPQRLQIATRNGQWCSTLATSEIVKLSITQYHSIHIFV